MGIEMNQVESEFSLLFVRDTLKELLQTVDLGETRPEVQRALDEVQWVIDEECEFVD